MKRNSEVLGFISLYDGSVYEYFKTTASGNYLYEYLCDRCTHIHVGEIDKSVVKKAVTKHSNKALEKFKSDNGGEF